MSKKRVNPFGFLYSENSDTESASEGEFDVAKQNMHAKKLKSFMNSASNSDPEVEILRVEPGPAARQVEIVKVECARKKTPDVEIVKVIPGNSDKDPCKKNWPIQCRRIKVEGSVGKRRESGKS